MQEIIQVLRVTVLQALGDVTHCGLQMVTFDDQLDIHDLLAPRLANPADPR